MDSKELQAWILTQMQEPYLPALFDEIREKAEGFTQQALTRGDTNYEKGAAKALRWAADIPLNKLKQGTGADT